ncbi:MAG: methylmalonyl-CoA epimerase [Myxococcota bacterium]|jgi:methylmalonyl-CoA/ethylmalonyl-CoA epimerase|nr:methylmalonyl-CoA epimerase [Myxococcota bacterium]
MRILKIDHIGVAVPTIEAGKGFWTDILGLSFAGEEEVSSQKVKTAFFPVGESEFELLESTAPDGPIARFIEKKGAGFQHIALRVENIDEALAELKAKNVQLIDEQPRAGAGGARIAFIHPKATGGILVELCERSNA